MASPITITTTSTSTEFATILLSYLGALGIGAISAVIVVFVIIKFFFPAYLTEKGKNLATREDIAQITKEIEKVKSEYALILEELRARNQLRLAALDRRLEAHQEAFVLWREIMGTVHTEEIGSTVNKCHAWWEKNCLYLAPDVRESFLDAYRSANSHNSYLQNRTDVQIVRENWARIMKAGNDIVAAVQLPGLTSNEKIEINKLADKTTT